MKFIKKLLGLDKPPANVVSINDENFKAEIIQSDKPVLLDIWSPGCQPCATLAPIVMELSRIYSDQLKVAELNSAQAPKTASKLHVRGTPTVLYFYKGQIKERVVGFRGQLYHQDYIDNELLPSLS